MNFVAIIGMIKSIKELQNPDQKQLLVNVYDSEADKNTEVSIQTIINNETEIEERNFTVGDIIGVKGRLNCLPEGTILVGERAQIF
jgi:hypothetical protein